MFFLLMSIIAAVILSPAANAFTFNSLNIPSPVLDKFAQDTAIKKHTGAGTLLDVKLNIGKDDDKSCMSLNGMLLELLPDDITKSQAKNYPGLPGANGPNPKSSTGAKHLQVKTQPFFIDMMGKHSVTLENGSWEIVWRDGEPSGSFICGFHLPETHQRNGSILPKGRLYVSFPVWTIESLNEALIEKRKAETRASEFLETKDKAMHKYVTEGNFFTKAMNYREALAAVERYSLVNLCKDVPEYEETMVLEDDMLLAATKGTVWTKKGGIFAQHIFLGTATASPAVSTDAASGGLRP